MVFCKKRKKKKGFICLSPDSNLGSLALCSRNFKNLKLRQHSMKILQFAYQSDFTWNQILVNLNGQKMPFLALLGVLNFNVSKFEPFLKSQIYPNSKLSLWNCKNGNFWDSNFCQNCFHAKLSGTKFLYCGLSLHILKVSGA